MLLNPAVASNRLEITGRGVNDVTTTGYARATLQAILWTANKI
jgi:hypothetical protein